MNKAIMFATLLVVVIAGVSISLFAGTPVAVPEPTTLALLATGLGAVALVRRFRNK
jgi:hypothetical protein